MNPRFSYSNAVTDRFPDFDPESSMPPASTTRRTFTSLGVKPTQHRVAAEALLRRLTKSGSVPTVNTLVDIGNVVFIRYAVPVAVFD